MNHLGTKKLISNRLILRKFLSNDSIELLEGYFNQDEFLYYVTDILIAGEEFDDFTECHYEGITRNNANMMIDGYAFDDTDGSCCVFISDYHGPYEDDAIRAEDINKWFRRIRYFVEEAIKYELYLELEESTQEYEFARTLYYDNEEITKFRFYLLTDAYNKQRKKNMKLVNLLV